MSTDSNRPLDLQGLRVRVLDAVTGKYKTVLEGIDLRVDTEGAVGITGQSGGGKSTLASTIAGLLPHSACISATHWRMFGKEILQPGQTLSGRRLARRIHARAGRDVFLISQDARSSLIPYRSVRWHLQRAAGRDPDRRDPERLAQILESVGFQHAASYLNKLPGEMSTGQCQRVQLAMANRLCYRLLLADEPLASVDHELLDRLTEQLLARRGDRHALVLVSHNLTLLRQVVQRVVVIADGQVAEEGPIDQVLDAERANTAQTRRLLSLSSVTRFRLQGEARTVDEDPPSEQLLSVRGLSKRFHATVVLRHRGLELHRGQRVGLLAASGGGKTTFARILMGLTDYDDGTIERFPQRDSRWNNRLTSARARSLWENLQMVHQDTDLIFDPSAAIGEALVQAYQVIRPTLRFGEAWNLAGRLAAEFHLPGGLLLAPPGQLSGGERKRAAIARALAVFGFLLPGEAAKGDRVLILDEPTVGVDVFLQGILAETLLRAQRDLRLSYLVISHDREFVSKFCQRVFEWLPGS